LKINLIWQKKKPKRKIENLKADAKKDIQIKRSNMKQKNTGYEKEK